MILLEYSEKRVPIINLDDFGRISFSTLTKHPTKGYKFVCYSRSVVDNIRIKKKVKGELVERYVKTEKRDSISLDMDLQRKIGTTATKGFPKGTINPRLADWLRKVFKRYVTEDKYFPYDKIETLRKYLARYDIETIIAKPQRKRKNAKRNGRHSKAKKSV